MAHCDRQHLQRLLDESLPETIERDVANHVATCADCRDELETLAAGRSWWQEATTRLSKSSARLAGDSADEHDCDGQSHEDAANHFAADFAVDFLSPSDDSTHLGRLGDYEIIEVIGRGGMGVVLKGYQKELNRFVAVKVLAPHLATSGAARRRFTREAQATAAVVHPHVMAIHSVHSNVKLPYLVMPYVACESLQERLDRHGPLDVKDILRIGMQAALGLAAAHAQGLVHRDVKPANILLETTVDRVMLTDFGLARAVDDATLTRTGVIAGTPLYMSPEQANGDAVDHRSDLFSLGGVLYAMCTGRSPFRAETTFGVLRRIREGSPRSVREINPDIPEWLEQVVLRLLAKQAGDRIESATDVAQLLERCLAHLQQPTTTPVPPEIAAWGLASSQPADARSRGFDDWRTRWIAGVGAVVVVATVALIGTRGWPIWRSPVPMIHTSSPPAANDPALQWDALRSDIHSAEQAVESFETEWNRNFELPDRGIQAPVDTNREEKP